MYSASSIVTTVKSKKMAGMSDYETNKFSHNSCGEILLKIASLRAEEEMRRRCKYGS
jgi:hypothetical protein